MLTKNHYNLPLDKKHIKKTITNEAPGHIIYKEKTGAEYDLTNAVDFLCDIGTPIKAAVDGEIIHIYNKSKNTILLNKLNKNTGFDEEQEGNLIIIKHANGEYSQYSHLKFGSIKIKVGQKVKAGEVIGLSGHTGVSIKPHLHFFVFKFYKPKSKGWKSLEVRWNE
jgi:murein DD-endopeptidase MepM/ murein hydrolase activator NlpD